MPRCSEPRFPRGRLRAGMTRPGSPRFRPCRRHDSPAGPRPWAAGPGRSRAGAPRTTTRMRKPAPWGGRPAPPTTDSVRVAAHGSHRESPGRGDLGRHRGRRHAPTHPYPAPPAPRRSSRARHLHGTPVRCPRTTTTTHSNRLSPRSDRRQDECSRDSGSQHGRRDPRDLRRSVAPPIPPENVVAPSVASRLRPSGLDDESSLENMDGCSSMVGVGVVREGSGAVGRPRPRPTARPATTRER